HRRRNPRRALSRGAVGSGIETKRAAVTCFSQPGIGRGVSGYRVWVQLALCCVSALVWCAGAMLAFAQGHVTVATACLVLGVLWLVATAANARHSAAD